MEKELPAKLLEAALEEEAKMEYSPNQTKNGSNAEAAQSKEKFVIADFQVHTHTCSYVCVCCELLLVSRVIRSLGYL